jgi:acyl CoA:acetate/3-ketoacid CoA transferase alpha subunit
MERGLRADLAIVKAWKADPEGNLIYRMTARNFNPVMATAADVTIVEVEEIVEPGALDPNCIHTPGIYVDRIVKGAVYEKKIEQRTVRKRETAAADVTVVEAEEIVEPGAIDPDCVHTPGIFVQRIVKSTINEKRIEFRTVRAREDA